MSRPFSYNDENFTVIGNVLFCHIEVSHVEPNSNIAEIPPAIYNRLLQSSTKAIVCRISNLNDSYIFGIFVSKENGKYYLKIGDYVNGTFLVTAFMFLKDI